MTHDQTKKTLRSFQCRDYLWEIFGQMSAELECSVDYLINEAMRQYARSRNYGVRGQSQPGMPRAMPPSAPPPHMGGAPSAGPPMPRPGAPHPGGHPGHPGHPGAPHPGGMAPPPAGPGIPSLGRPPKPSIPSAPPPPPSPGYGGAYGGAPSPGYGGSPYPGGGPPGYPGGGAPAPAPPARPSAPPPLPGAPQPGYGGTGRPSLFVIFNGQKIPVAKDEFVIGRGSKTADLPIKDGNISRRHAAVVFQGGAFYIKDLGSTNGIEYQGRRIDSKRIEEGDLIQICDYQLRFTYR